MIPNQVFEQLAGGAFDKCQVIIVTKMLLVTVEAARAQMMQEMSAMRSDYGRLIIEAVEATEAKIFARLEEEKALAEMKKKERRELAAARKKARQAAVNGASHEQGTRDTAVEAAQLAYDAGQVELFGAGGNGGNVAKVLITNENKSDIVDCDDKPVTGEVAAAFEDNAAYKDLLAEWEAKAAADLPQRPMGSPLAAVKSLGEAMIASFERQEEEERATALSSGGADSDILMIANPAVGAPVEILEAAQ